MFKFIITGHLERDADALAKKLTDECSSIEELQKLVQDLLEDTIFAEEQPFYKEI